MHIITCKFFLDKGDTISLTYAKKIIEVSGLESLGRGGQHNKEKGNPNSDKGIKSTYFHIINSQQKLLAITQK